MPPKGKRSSVPEQVHILAEDLLQIGREICGTPTAPGLEQHVVKKVLCFLEGLPFCTVSQDEFGNIIAIYDHDSAGREPFRLVAHLDHPAFVVKGDKELWFRGGVGSKYFPGRAVRFHSLASVKPLGAGKTISLKDENEGKSGGPNYYVELEEPFPTGTDFAVWELPPPRCSKQTPLDQDEWEKLVKKQKPAKALPGDALFIAPACDDLVEVSTMVALLRHLAKSRAKACVHFLFTRCEETGFYGALAALEAKEPLPKMTTISLEISNSVGFATVGGGPILRVGDRISVFDSAITQWLSDSFSEMHERKKAAGVMGSPPFVRKLMAGGACEGSVFHLAGFPTGALCLPMFNYHNMGANNEIHSEMVSLRDWQSLYDGLIYLATESGSIAESKQRLLARFAGFREKALAALVSNVG